MPGGVFGTFAEIGRKVKGEISKLRQGSGAGYRTGSSGGTYTLNTSTVDFRFARNLYDNTEEGYKLGAWASKPVINTCVGFMGVPRFRAEDPEAQGILDEFHAENVSAQQQTHRDALRDGDCWVWITREEDEESAILYPELEGVKFKYNIIPPEMLSDEHTRRDPVTGKIIEYGLVSGHTWTDGHGNDLKCEIIQRINKDERTIEVEGDRPEDFETGTFPNPWDFIPIVQFSNERDASAANGKSDLEAIEPFMKAYHDVALGAIKGSKLHSTPRLKLQLKDVAGFLRNNFGVTDPAKFVQEGRAINLDGKELLIFQEGDDAGFIEVKSATGDAKALLKLLFFCIVDASETPEFAFGVHTPSSQASVKEQMPVLIRRVARKREHFAASWTRLARMVLAMHSQATGRRFASHAVEVLWDEVDPRDDKDVADALKTFVEALSNAIDHYLISQEAAVQFLSAYIDTMNDFASDDPEIPGERERIIRDRIRMARLGDGDVAEGEKDAIEKTLAELEGDEA